MKILVCDDDNLMREVVAVILLIGNHQVEIAYDGQEALEKIQANSFDVLITDHKMPRLSGIKLIEHLREMKNPVKVIMMTAYSDEIDMEALDELRLNGFFKKPFNSIDLLDCVKNLGC